MEYKHKSYHHFNPDNEYGSIIDLEETDFTSQREVDLTIITINNQINGTIPRDYRKHIKIQMRKYPKEESAIGWLYTRKKHRLFGDGWEWFDIEKLRNYYEDIALN